MKNYSADQVRSIDILGEAKLDFQYQVWRWYYLLKVSIIYTYYSRWSVGVAVDRDVMDKKINIILISSVTKNFKYAYNQ